MSLARAAGAVLRPRQIASPLLRTRSASSHAHDEHHDDGHGEAHDATTYPKEDFSGPFWRRFVLFSLGVVGFYKFAPSQDEDNVLTRAMASFSTPSEVWQKLSFKHLVQSVEVSEESLLIAGAQRAPVHRYRYTQRFEQISPHLHPVGLAVDVSEVEVKNV
ncbi:uncharacterized protein B0H18DRAFT_926892 [Fomitopsis serialis]|uniref:uncharacterized protein n=1 Tax=Fomitopsis serialis TaxID=139415 RepID=UPI002008722B|nr:uncharacterized protein B0H18DRAFT_926892 [Neoantrodia serialis]KAH9935398.1 hypothetical protein B0H18DRAFT_926892 [Neoantrodia serialis]